MCGLPGVGKTTIARMLASLISGVVISSDEIRKSLFRKPRYRHQDKKLIYDVIILLAGYLYNANVNCILDATFSKEKTRQEVQNKLGLAPNKLQIIECICPEDIVMARLKARTRDFSDANYSVYRMMKRFYEPVRGERTIIDTSRISNMEIRKLASDLLHPTQTE